MAHYELTTPLTEKDVRRLRIRDTVLLHGRIYGIRDATLIRMFQEGRRPPVDLTGATCLHVAPSLKRTAEGWDPISVGTTTSTRMEPFTPGLIETYGVRAIIGKAGLLEGSLDAMSKFGACYLAIVGGAAALETTQVEAVEQVYWEDLHPEAIYQFRVKSFGPLTVAMDSHGGHIYFEVKEEAKRRLPAIFQRLGL